MMYEYDLTPEEVDNNLVEEIGEEIIGWATYDAEDIINIFEYDAEDRIEEHIRDLDELQEADEDEIDMLVAQAIDSDLPAVALELARDFVGELIHDLEMTKDRMDDNIDILENIYQENSIQGLTTTPIYVIMNLH